jgi:hypothetical protein
MIDNQELLNQIALMEQALLFYGNEINYEPDSDLIDKDRGSQARFALEQLKKIKDINEEMGEDYIKLLQNEADKTQTPENIMKLINEIKNIDKNG